MANQHIQPDGLWLSAPHNFSQVVVSTGTKIIHCAGQTAWDNEMNIVGGDDLEQQMIQALENVKTALAAGGATLQDVVRLDIYVVDYSVDKVGAVGSALGRPGFTLTSGPGSALGRFFDPDHLPANTLLGIQALALPEFLVEVTATAVVDA